MNEKREAIQLSRQIVKDFDVMRQRVHQIKDYKQFKIKKFVTREMEEKRFLSTIPYDLKKSIVYFKNHQTRKKSFVDAKCKLVKNLRNNWKLSYPMIAQLLNMNHASIIHLYFRKLKIYGREE